MPSFDPRSLRDSVRRRASAEAPLPAARYEPRARAGKKEGRYDLADRPLELAVIAMKFPVASETFVSARLETLQGMGNRVRVFTMRRPEKDFAKLIAERGLDRLELNQTGLVASLRGALAALRRPRLLGSTFRWLWRCTKGRPGHLLRALVILPRSFDVLARLEREPPDLLHLEWGHFPVVAAHLVQRRLPHVVVSVSLIAYDLNTEFGGTVDVVREADVIRTQAAINVDQISRFTGVEPERIAVIYDGVDVSRLERMTSVAEKVPGRVVCAGRLVAEKGVDDVIRVFAATLEAAPYATLHVLGEGPARSGLEALAAELGASQSVVFFGHISHEQVLRELGRAEVLLHLSRTERLPNVVKEAMVCECLPITTRTEGIEELVTHGETGFVVEHDDLESAAELLGKVITRQVEIEPMTEAAKRFIHRNFDHQESVDKLVKLWREALHSDAQEVKIAEPV